jgi:hypothetical protein
MLGFFFPIGVAFTFLPDPVDIGFVGTGSALGAVLAGFASWVYGDQVEDVAQTAANGALALGTIALVTWLSGLAGVRFD